MKFAPIAPIAWLDSFPSEDHYHLVLPHLLSDASYFDYYTHAEGHKILDNGEAEGVHIDPGRIIRCAQLVGADEIVAPDRMGDRETTVRLLRTFSEYARKHDEFTYGAVVQGRTVAEQELCLRAIMDMDWVSVLYLPRIMTNNSDSAARARFWLRHRRKIEKRFDAVHALGASKHLEEPRLLEQLTDIRGIDTSLPFVLAIRGRYIGTSTYMPRESGYFYVGREPYTVSLAHRNVDLFQKWCRNEAVEGVNAQSV